MEQTRQDVGSFFEFQRWIGKYVTTCIVLYRLSRRNAKYILVNFNLLSRTIVPVNSDSKKSIYKSCIGFFG